MRKLTYSVASVAMIGGIFVGTAGPASAAHCNDAGGPGHSDFAAHVQSTNGPGGHNEGDHRGWSSCR